METHGKDFRENQVMSENNSRTVIFDGRKHDTRVRVWWREKDGSEHERYFKRAADAYAFVNSYHTWEMVDEHGNVIRPYHSEWEGHAISHLWLYR